MKMSAIDANHLLSLSCLLHIISLVKAQPYINFNCDTSSNYTSGSVYQKDLKLALSSLAANASLTGYYTTEIGQPPDVYGLIQCRGYVSREDCKTCANNVTSAISKVCPDQKEAYYIAEDCSLQYSDQNFFNTSDSLPRMILVNAENATNPALFQSQLEYLINNISSYAVANFSRLASGSMSFAGSQTIYAMVQCTRNLAGNDCLSCLQNIINYIPGNNIGGRIFALSCNIRYETYTFFTLSTPPASIPSPTLSTPPASIPSPPSQASTSSTQSPPFALQPNSTSHEGKSSKTIAMIVTPVAVALIGMPTICGCLYWKKAKRKRVGGVNEDDNESMESLSIGLKTLKVATRNFSEENKLGEGGFGPVYKGKLRDGREIAVKRLSSRSKQGLEELKTEVMLVAKLLHRNLVRLFGFCLEEEEKLLVYEYLPYGSLDKILFDPNRRIALEWSRRYKIVIGIARGLLYLHEDSQLRIVHRDLKASNILLDESMNPKISDFGLARLFSGSQTQANTNRIAGTYGYIAPEYAKLGNFSIKSDVYSFGILVLEIVTGRKNASFQNAINIQTHAWQHWANGTALELLDPTLVDQWTKHEVLNCIHIALLCVQEAPADRPTMSTVAMMLSSFSLCPPSPSRPAFFVSRSSFRSEVKTEDSAASRVEKSEQETLQQSINEVTISELNCPR